MSKLINNYIEEAKQDFNEVKEFCLHVGKNFAYRDRINEFKTLSKQKKKSGIIVSYYDLFDWCKKKKGFYLPEAKLPNKINWFTVTHFEGVKRGVKRKVIHSVIGSSLNEAENKTKVRISNLIKRRKNLISKILKGTK